MTPLEQFKEYQPMRANEVPQEPLHTAQDLNATIANRIIADWWRGERLREAAERALNPLKRCLVEQDKTGLPAISMRWEIENLEERLAACTPATDAHVTEPGEVGD